MTSTLDVSVITAVPMHLIIKTLGLHVSTMMAKEKMFHA